METKPKPQPAAVPAPAPEPDPYEGMGGSYAIDPLTGRRVPRVPAPETPETPEPPAAVPPAAPLHGGTAAAGTRPYWKVDPVQTPAQTEDTDHAD